MKPIQCGALLLFIYTIAGSHSADMKTPPRAAENAWYAFVAPRVQAELAHKVL